MEDEALARREAALLRLSAQLDQDTRAILEEGDGRGAGGASWRGGDASRSPEASGASRRVRGGGSTRAGSDEQSRLSNRLAQATAAATHGGRSPVRAAAAPLAAEGVDGDGGDSDGALSPSLAPPAGIGSEATIRFQKAKMKVLNESLRQEKLKSAEQVQALAELRRQLKAEAEDKKSLAKQVKEEQQQQQATMRRRTDGDKEVGVLTAEVADLKRELLAAQKAARAADIAKNAIEVRLHRALEDVDKFKAATAAAKASQKDATAGLRQDTLRLEGSIRRLERQKMELLGAFRKQLKLIDVLKRQKVHIEAARLLSFTEEEFVKVLDWAI